MVFEFLIDVRRIFHPFGPKCLIDCCPIFVKQLMGVISLLLHVVVAFLTYIKNMIKCLYDLMPVCYMFRNVLIMSFECERLQTRRPRQFFGVDGLMVFSQSLTGKPHSYTYLLFLVSVVFLFYISMFFQIKINEMKKKKMLLVVISFCVKTRNLQHLL